MSLLQRIESDYIVAYKAKEAITLTVLRLVKTAVKNLQVERLGKALSDADVLDVLTKQCKQRQESITMYRAAGRDDLADKEEAELTVLRLYLPEQMSGDALSRVIDALISQTGAAGPKDMGQVMQALTAAHKGSYDGKEASELVKTALSAL